MKKGWKIARGILVALLTLLVAALLLLQAPFVQTWLTRSVTERLTQDTDAGISFSKIHFRPFNTLVVKDLVIEDKQADIPGTDTVFCAGNLSASFSLKGLLRKEGLHLSRVQARDAYFHLVLLGEKKNNLKRLLGTEGKHKKDSLRKEQGAVFDINKAELDNIRFRLTNVAKLREDRFGIDWSDLDVTADHLSGRDIVLKGGDLTATLQDGSLREKSGYEIHSLSGDVKVGHGETLITGLDMKDPWSEVNGGEYSMHYTSIKDFSDYIDKVRMELRVRNSRLDARTLSYFAPSLQGNGLSLQVADLDAEGTVQQLYINRLAAYDPDSKTRITASGRVSDAASKSGLTMDLDLENLEVTAPGIGRLVRDFSPGTTLSLDKYAPGQTFVFNGRLAGSMDDLGIKGNLSSGIGSLTADLKLGDLAGKAGNMSVGGLVETKDLDLGQIALVKALGPCSLKSRFDATLGKEGPEVEIDTLSISRLRLLDYDYSRIIGAGTYSGKAFDGRIVSQDPNLQFLFQGLFSLSDQTRNGVYKYYASLGYADLEALHLDKRGISRASGEIRANFITVNNGDMTGEIRGTDIFLENAQGRHDIGDILIRSHNNESVNRINLTSEITDGRYIGSGSPTALIEDLKALANGKPLSGKGYEMSFDFHDSRELLSFVLPGLYVADSTKLDFKLTEEGKLRADLDSPRLAFGKNNAKGFHLDADNPDGELDLRITADAVNAASLELKADTIRLKAKKDSLLLTLKYDNGSALDGRGEVTVAGRARRTEDGKIAWSGAFLPSLLTIDGDDWKIDASEFSYLDGDFAVDNVRLHSGIQSINLDGGFSQDRTDTLRLEMQHFDLALLNSMMKTDLDIQSTATGKALLTSPWKSDDARLLMHLQCDSTRVGGYDVGTLQLATSLDEQKDRVRLLARNELDGRKTIDLKGYYFPGRKSLDADVAFDGFNAGCVSPILKSVFSRLEGGVYGDVHVTGPMDGLEITSDGTRFEDALLEVAFTKVPYRVSGPFHLDETGVHFDNLTVSDGKSGTGTVEGGIRFDRMKDFRMDTRLKFQDMKCLQTTENDNPTFYGDITATGSLGITGPFNAIRMDVDARTTREGNLHVPIDNARGDSDANLLTFKQPVREIYVDPYEQMVNAMTTRDIKSNDFGIHLKIDATPVVKAHVEVDRSAGNVLTANGNGTLDLDVRPSRDYFAINGEYALRGGNFHFNAMDIAKRDFTISDGSTVRFNGDIMDSDLNIQGQYSTKASIATLIADTTSVSSRRTVNCGIAVTGKLREPVLDFSIDIPDLDPTTQSRVQTALNTDDKVQRQLIALLISGGFLPDEQSGIVNNTTVLYANVAEVMAGQLNTILQKLDIPLDLGLNYQASDSGTDIFDVAVSTQLLGDRVLVNGAFGNKAYGSGATTDIAGDLDIEIKLDRPGRLRLTLFSHSVDDYTNSLDNSQRNGVGLAFQREFNTFKDLVRSLTAGRKKKEQMRQEAASAERKVRTIRIDEETEEQP